MKSLILTLCLAICNLLSYSQILRLNEVMSSNVEFLMDNDGDAPDWIELFNTGANDINLKGYGLSDKKSEPFKWIFPEYTIRENEFLLVFASGKDMRYWNTIIAQGDDWKYLVPTAEPTTNWRIASYSDNSWDTGKSGFGMGDDDDATILTGIKSIFLRKKFNIDNVADVKQLMFHMDYDDGFVAYLNGVEIARSQMKLKGKLPGFEVLASDQHEAVMYTNQAPEMFEISYPSDILKTGENILAIQVHNDHETSSDLTAIPFLSVATVDKPVNRRIIDILNLKENELHTNFKLDCDGESLYLTSPLGVLIDSVNIGYLPMNYSKGRSSKDETKWAVFNIPTPRNANSGEETNGQKPGVPSFNLPAGIYSSEIKVVMTAPFDTDTIYYTLDGTIPTKNSLISTHEIVIPTSKVLKARILKYGMLPGDVVTNSYMVYDHHNLPIVSLSMNPADLWDYNTGIYADGPGWTPETPHYGANFWMDWEKACHLELIESTGEKAFDVDAGVGIMGNFSRSREQKSLAIHCRKIYGFEEINYKIFNERPYTKYKNIVLRNSGNDFNFSMFRDGLMHGLTFGLNFDQQAYRPSIIFINGEYWGIQNIREKVNKHMIAQHNNVDPDDITILENHGTIIQGSSDDYWMMFSFLENNTLATEENYNKMLEYIDVNSFIDYFASQIYFRNHDWPGNNIRYWKTNDESGRWRWILFDTDYGMGLYGSRPTENSLAFATDPNQTIWPNPAWSTLMLRRLLENPAFRDQFVNRFADLLNSNFRADNVNRAIDLKSGAIADEIEFHLTRWGGGSKDGWLSIVNNMKNFATARPAHVFSHIKDKFGFESPQVITAQADSMQGLIQLNSLKLRNFPWQGAYFPNVPITFTAIPKVGYRFVKWTGITTKSTSATITVTPQVNMILNAEFEPDGNHYDDIVINEISVNNNAIINPGDWIELYNKGSFDIDISGWKITDSDQNHQYIFAANTWLRANEYLVLSNDLTLINNVFSVAKNLYGPFNFGLSTSADAVMLYGADGQLVDQVLYTNVLPWPTGNPDELWSLELKSPSCDNSLGSNWEVSFNKGTPGLINTPLNTDVVEDITANTSTNKLFQNYPNPFNDGTYVEFKLAKQGKYTISILDVNGRILKRFNGNDQLATSFTIYWDGKDDSGKTLPTGIYLYRLETDGFSEMKRMVKVK